jgi:hypothetical protein
MWLYFQTPAMQQLILGEESVLRTRGGSVVGKGRVEELEGTEELFEVCRSDNVAFTGPCGAATAT